jgi:hypothetical protein
MLFQKKHMSCAVAAACIVVLSGTRGYCQEQTVFRSEALFPAAITGTAFADANSNGMRDAGEQGLEGVQIRLSRLWLFFFPVDVATAQTDAEGNYAFSNLRRGIYVVEATASDGAQRTSANPARAFFVFVRERVIDFGFDVEPAVTTTTTSAGAVTTTSAAATTSTSAVTTTIVVTTTTSAAATTTVAPTTTTTASAGGQIIADHTVVDLYDDIPEEWINEVKKMLVNIPGESHGRGYLYGLGLVAALDSRFAQSQTWSGAPEAVTDAHLRAVRTYRNLANTSWVTTGGEEDFWTNADALTMMKNHMLRMNTAGNPVSALGFGWCWDMTADGLAGDNQAFGGRWAGRIYTDMDNRTASRSVFPWGNTAEDSIVSMQDYLDAVDEYNAYAQDNDLPTVVFFTTGPIDGYTGENGWQRYQKHEYIRSHVRADSSRVLFDYADILSWDNGTQTTATWSGHTYQTGNPTLATGGTGYSDGVNGGCHISEEGCLRLGKAMWWMLARIAGWDGT